MPSITRDPFKILVVLDGTVAHDRRTVKDGLGHFFRPPSSLPFNPAKFPRTLSGW